MSVFDRLIAGEWKVLFQDKPGTHSERLKQYREDCRKQEILFRKALEEEFALSEWPQPVLDAVYSKAWEDGHAYGYHEVACHYSELCDFVKVVRQ